MGGDMLHEELFGSNPVSSEDELPFDDETSPMNLPHSQEPFFREEAVDEAGDGEVQVEATGEGQPSRSAEQVAGEAHSPSHVLHAQEDMWASLSPADAKKMQGMLQ